MIEEIDYHGWKSLRLYSGKASIVIPLDIGPRVVACSIEGKSNLFHNVADELGGKDEPEWLLRGGHRLWHAPEHMPRTYGPDNSPIIPKIQGDNIISLEAPQADHSGMLKSIRIEAHGNESFSLDHSLRNEGMWPVQCSVWSPTVLQSGGRFVLPLLPKGSHPKDLLPTYTLIPWSYTDFSLPCWKFQKDFIGIESTGNNIPQKLGISAYPGWSAYWQEDGTFVKYAPVVPDAVYPDNGSSYEVFCNDFMLEMETLGVFTTIQPGESAHHLEHWKVFPGLEKPDSDEAFNSGINAKANQWISTLE